MPAKMISSNLAEPQQATLRAPPSLAREDTVDRSSKGSNTSSVPSMVEDHGSDVSVDDDTYYRTSGEQIWDSFWQSGCEEDEDDVVPAAEDPTVSATHQYPALIAPSQGLPSQQQFLPSHKRPTQTQSLGTIEAPAYASEHRLSDQSRLKRRGVQPCRVSYSIFPPRTDLSRQKTVRARRCPPHLNLDEPRQRISSEGSPPRQALRASASARNLRSGSASSAFSATSAYSAASDASAAPSDQTAFTTPAASPRVSWEGPQTPKPTHVSQCMDYRKLAARKQSLPNLRSSATITQRPLPAPRSATADDFAQGEARNARVVATFASAEPYPRPLFAPPPPHVAPLQPSRRAPLPPVSQRLPPPVSATRQKIPPLSSRRALPNPLTISTRPLPPLPLSLARPQTPNSAPPRPQRPDCPPSSASFTYRPKHHLSPPRPPPIRTTSAPQTSTGTTTTTTTIPGDFQPPVVSVFDWDSDSESDSGTASPNPANTFAKRIARGFAHIQANRHNHHHNSNKDESSHNSHSHSQQFPHQAARQSKDFPTRHTTSDDLTRIRSGEPVSRFAPRLRALTVEDVRRVEEDLERLRLAREQVARERSSVEVAHTTTAAAAQPAPPKGPTRQKSALFGRMLGWRTS